MGREKDRPPLPFYRPGAAAPLRLPPDSKALLLLRQIRDEAHWFAVTYHRRLRGKRDLSSELDAIPGIGPTRTKALIKAFGALERLKRRASKRSPLCPRSQGRSPPGSNRLCLKSHNPILELFEIATIDAK